MVIILKEGKTTMKLSILTSVSALALAAATPAFAQSNNASVTQSGLAQQAAVTQAYAQSSQATVNQNGADVPPVGVVQPQAPWSQQLSNIASVTQNGVNGVVTVDQSGNN